MELSQIKYFVVLAGTLHFTKAAQACHVSQPALTKSIQKLEAEFGGPLFHRDRTRTQLTELGHLILGPLQHMLRAASEAKTQAEAFRRRGASPLRIGLELSLPAALLTPALTALRQRAPDLQLSLHQAAQAELCEHLLASRLDVAVLVARAALHRRLQHWGLFAEGYVLICPPEHPFRELDSVAIARLADACLLLPQDPAHPARQYLHAAMAEAGVCPPRRLLVGSDDQIVEMVQAGLGVALVSDRLPCTETLLRRPLAAEPAPGRVVLASVAGRTPGPTPGLFLRLMRAQARGQDGCAGPPTALAA